MSARVISLESILVDVTLRVPHLPEHGGDVIAQSADSHVGGGFNLVYAAARQDANVSYGGLIGTGPNGDMIRQALAACGVAQPQPPDTRGDSGMCLTLVDASAERTFITSPGVESQLSKDHLDAMSWRRGDVLALSGYDLLYPDSGAAIAAWMRDLPADVVVLLDPGPLIAQIPQDRWRAVLPRISVLSLNEREALSLASDSGESWLTDVRRAAGLGDSAALVVRRGKDGCLHSMAAQAPIHTPSLKVSAIDSTGAGDTHCGVLAAELAVRNSASLEVALPAALVRANVAAALSVTRRGPAASPTRAEVDAAIPR